LTVSFKEYSNNNGDIYGTCFTIIKILAEASTLNEIVAKYSVSPVMIGRCKKEFLEQAAEDPT